MAKVKPRVPRGMRDFLPRQMIRRQYVVRVVQEVFEQFGFEPLLTPSVELAETLMGKYGPDAEKLIFEVRHRQGKEDLALRYDLSVPLSRVVAMYPELQKPFKRYQMSPVWRAERPQKGRYREFWQCDADSVGSASMLADAEILNVIYAILTRLGFRQFVMKLNDRKILTGIGQYSGVKDAQLGNLYRSIDKLQKIGLSGVKTELQESGIAEAAVKRLLDLLQVEGENRRVLAELRTRLADYPLALEGIGELEEILDYLEALGIPPEFYQIEFAMVRGLEYYTGPIFETVVEEPKIGSITGGGRFDELVGMFAARSLPATGTTIGIERIVDVMDELDMFPPEVGQTVAQALVTRFDANSTGESLRVASELRRGGLNVELYFETDPLGAQIRYALKKGIPYMVIVGPEEVTAGKVTLRNLRLEQQETVARGEMLARLKAWQKG